MLALVLIALVAGSAIARASEVADTGLGGAIALYSVVGLLSAGLALGLIARRR